MAHLTFYGGTGEIGGSKILLEDGDKNLFLDFGFSYKRRKLFYEEYLKPRSGAGLLDPVTMGLVPPLQGIYREDLESGGLWDAFKNRPLFRKLEHVDSVLLSHAHFDHSGYISFLNSEIPVYATGKTAFLTKAIQDSGKSDYDQQVCYFSPVEKKCPVGWKQEGLLSITGEAKRQRQFHIPEAELKALSPDARRFWEFGFYEKTARQKDINSLPLKTLKECPFRIISFPVDHSIPGACAFGIETDSGWVIYSGDMRLHGKKGHLTEEFIAGAAKLKPRALIIEGTNVRRQNNVPESEVYEKALKAVSGAKSLVIADFSPRDIDRLLTFLSVAKETRRKLAVLPKDAYLLKTVRLFGGEIPNLAEDGSIVIYQDTIGSRAPNLWVQNICKECEDKIVLAQNVREAQDKFILAFSFFDLNELPSLSPAPGSLYLFSSSEPHDEEQEIDFRRLHNWLRHFSLKGFGLPVEKDGKFEIPEEERGLHASGHACGADLLRIASEIKPELLIPVHTESPEFYAENLKDTKIKVLIPEEGRSLGI